MVPLVLFLGLFLVSWTPEGRLERFINRARERNDCPILRINDVVSSRADNHSLQMAKRGLLFHSDLSKTLSGIRWSLAAENVGVGYTARQVHKAFMGSKPHRENILDCRMRRLGLGAVRRNSLLWVTEVFWRR